MITYACMICNWCISIDRKYRMLMHLIVRGDRDGPRGVIDSDWIHSNPTW